MNARRISITTDFITLDAFLKWAGVADTGGHAKALVASGTVSVNGQPDTRRGRKLRPGDMVTVQGAGQWEITREGD